MSKDLTKQNGSTAVATTGKDFFTQYGEAIRQTAIIGKLLKFSKGDWSAGETAEPVEDGSQFVANMDELLAGWVRWKDNRPTDHVMGKIADGYQPPRRNELGDDDKDQWEINEDGESRDPWQITNYLLMVDSEGNPYTFTTSSRGGLNAIGELCKSYGKLMRQHTDEYPIVEIGTGSYLHPNRAYGRIKYPTFAITGWAAKTVFDDVQAARGSDDRADEAEDAASAEDAAPAAPARGPTKTPPAKVSAAVAAKAKAKQQPARGKSKPRF